MYCDDNSGRCGLSFVQGPRLSVGAASAAMGACRNLARCRGIADKVELPPSQIPPSWSSRLGGGLVAWWSRPCRRFRYD